mmetsp:Transcript_41508/g.90390  ORF Transcript_41508/g.90390 Transcript_41508/m.90390 type:complete len:98 (-) Transcript_41508:132-425(-)
MMLFLNFLYQGSPSTAMPAPAMAVARFVMSLVLRRDSGFTSVALLVGFCIVPVDAGAHCAPACYHVLVQSEARGGRRRQVLQCPLRANHWATCSTIR